MSNVLHVYALLLYTEGEYDEVAVNELLFVLEIEKGITAEDWVGQLELVSVRELGEECALAARLLRVASFMSLAQLGVWAMEGDAVMRSGVSRTAGETIDAVVMKRLEHISIDTFFMKTLSS